MNNITKRLSIWAIVVGAILMIPLLANAPWTGSDFVFAGVGLFGAASLYEVLSEKVKIKHGRIIVGIAVGLMVLALWAWAVA
jgi:hypothetical protein